MNQQLLRTIPKTETLLCAPELACALERFPYVHVRAAVRAGLESIRARLVAGELDEVPPVSDIAISVVAALSRRGVHHLRPVVNATGVVLHTNLGRAPLGAHVAAHVAEIARGYSNLEYDLDRGERGVRYDHVESLICELVGAEAAIVVNNNAGAVFLMLNTLCDGRSVAVSRGELVEIGGSFRVPEIMARSGCELVEVGTTNKTHPEDYRRAIECEGASALLKVHTSNFVIQGFTENVSVSQLARLAAPTGARVLYDMGSALLFPHEIPVLASAETVRGCLRDGAEVVCFSGDKLLGSAQAGVIVGKRDLIERMKRNHLTRMLRADKLSLAALEATLQICRDPGAARERVPALRMLSLDVDACAQRAERLVCAVREACGQAVHCAIAPVADEVGGGSMPGVQLEGRAVAVRLDGMTAQELERRLREAPAPVIARICKGEVLLSMRTLLEGDEERIARALADARRRQQEAPSR